MDYEKKYKESMAKMSTFLAKHDGFTISKDGEMYKDLSEIFPELKESKGEKIRKLLVEAVTQVLQDQYCSNRGVSKENVIAWLEKQGENSAKNIVEAWKDMRLEVYQQASGNRHEPNYSDDTTKMFSLNDIDEIIEKISEQKPAEKYNITGIGSKNAQGKLGKMIKNLKSADKVETKFKAGNWVVIDGEVLHVKEVTEDGYLTDEGGHIPFRCEKEAMLWTIQDAKDGDVLADGNLPFIFKKIDSMMYSYAYCGISINSGFKIESEGVSDEWTWTQDIKPATQEQRDLLFQKMKEAGYEWDTEKKELKKIEPKTAAWTPMDEQRVENLLAIIEGHGYPGEVAWLNSLKDRVQPKQEWSREDSVRMDELCTFIQDYGDNFYCSSLKMIVINWLKSIKERVVPQQKQEWSEEDEKLFNDLSDTYFYNDEDYPEETYKRILKRVLDWMNKRAKSLRPQSWTKKDKERYVSCLQRLGTGDPKQPETINSKWFKEHVYPQSQWKPSDEQLDALHDAAVYVDKSMFPYPKGILMKLYEQLKKLRDE